MFRVALVCVVVLGALSCDSPLEVPGEFSVSARAALPDMQPPPNFEYVLAAAALPDGRIEIKGTFWGDLCGSEVRPSFTVGEGEARLHLTMEQVVSDPLCLAWVAFSEYVATFRDLSPGSYRVRVEHDDRRFEDHRPTFDLGEVVVR